MFHSSPPAVVVDVKKVGRSVSLEPHTGRCLLADIAYGYTVKLGPEISGVGLDVPDACRDLKALVKQRLHVEPLVLIQRNICESVIGFGEDFIENDFFISDVCTGVFTKRIYFGMFNSFSIRVDRNGKWSLHIVRREMNSDGNSIPRRERLSGGTTKYFEKLRLDVAARHAFRDWQIRKCLPSSPAEIQLYETGR